MNDPIKDSAEWEIEFDQKFPAFEGVGAPFPIFKDNPNREHIKQFIRHLLSSKECPHFIVPALQAKCPYCKNK